MILNLTGSKPPKCRHCKRDKGSHHAKTAACPFGASRNFPSFFTTHKFELLVPKAKKSQA